MRRVREGKPYSWLPRVRARYAPAAIREVSSLRNREADRSVDGLRLPERRHRQSRRILLPQAPSSTPPEPSDETITARSTDLAPDQIEALRTARPEPSGRSPDRTTDRPTLRPSAPEQDRGSREGSSPEWARRLAGSGRPARPSRARSRPRPGRALSHPSGQGFRRRPHRDRDRADRDLPDRHPRRPACASACVEKSPQS